LYSEDFEDEDEDEFGGGITIDLSQMFGGGIFTKRGGSSGYTIHMSQASGPKFRRTVRDGFSDVFMKMMEQHIFHQAEKRKNKHQKQNQQNHNQQRHARNKKYEEEDYTQDRGNKRRIKDTHAWYQQSQANANNKTEQNGAKHERKSSKHRFDNKNKSKSKASNSKGNVHPRKDMR
jgi:hypothetical protein